MSLQEQMKYVKGSARKNITKTPFLPMDNSSHNLMGRHSVAANPLFIVSGIV